MALPYEYVLNENLFFFFFFLEGGGGGGGVGEVRLGIGHDDGQLAEPGTRKPLN